VSFPRSRECFYGNPSINDLWHKYKYLLPGHEEYQSKERNYSSDLTRAIYLFREMSFKPTQKPSASTSGNVSYIPLGIGPSNPTTDINLQQSSSPSRDSIDSFATDYELESQLPRKKPSRGFAPGRRKKVKWAVVILAIVLVASFVVSGFFPSPRRQGLVGDVPDGVSGGEGKERIEG